MQGHATLTGGAGAPVRLPANSMVYHMHSNVKYTLRPAKRTSGVPIAAPTPWFGIANSARSEFDNELTLGYTPQGGTLTSHNKVASRIHAEREANSMAVSILE
jgi:hypothetical protein